MRIAAVVLAAGFSRRLGRPKQTVMLGGEMLMERAVRVAKEAELSPVIVVVSDASWVAMLQDRGAVAAVNAKAAEGMAASIRLGVAEAQAAGAAGVVLMTCDQVAVSAEHLSELCAEPDAAAGSSYAGKLGIPAYFPALSFAALQRLQGDRGASELLRDARAVACEELALDVDTEADLERARALLEQG